MRDNGSDLERTERFETFSRNIYEPIFPSQAEFLNVYFSKDTLRFSVPYPHKSAFLE